MITLEAMSSNPPEGAESLLLGLGAGESGFGGTQFGRGEMDLTDYLQHTARETNAENLPPGRVPQTTYWIVDVAAVGLLRLRHTLNEMTRIDGGHIGYYIRPSARRNGIATLALGLALNEATRIGLRRVMLTTTPDNAASIRVITGNGGKLLEQVASPHGEGFINQYWIELG